MCPLEEIQLSATLRREATGTPVGELWGAKPTGKRSLAADQQVGFPYSPPAATTPRLVGVALSGK
jgi:hypothetical protein